MKNFGIACCAALFLTCGLSASAADGGASAAKKSAAPVAPAQPGTTAPGQTKPAVAPVQGLGSFGKVLPVGQKNRDVKIPSFQDGAPSSFLRAKIMTRLDDERMEMEVLDIRMYGETREKDLRIMLPTATYHMPTEVLSSQERSRISRIDFDLQGDTLIFDTRTQQGKMTGNIHMIIHDAEAFSPQPDKPAAPGAKDAAQPKSPDKGREPSEKK